MYLDFNLILLKIVRAAQKEKIHAKKIFDTIVSKEQDNILGELYASKNGHPSET